MVIAVGLLAGAYQLGGGPPWPTSPKIDPGAPAYSPAFSIPFEVRNPSSLFYMHRTIFECEMENIKTNQGRVISVLNTQIASTRDTAIAPKAARPFTCLFPLTLAPGEAIVAARLSIMAQWHSEIPLLGWWVPSWEPTIGPFYWHNDLNPPRWIRGEPLL
jgi:hypothetical protein